jgi:hypothetical protein
MQQGKIGILAQNPATKERKLRLRWLLGVSSIPLFGIITAFGIAPQIADQSIPVATIVENISLPEQLAAIDATATENHPYWQADQVRKDDTLASLLERLNVRNDDATDFLRRAPEASALASKTAGCMNCTTSLASTHLWTSNWSTVLTRPSKDRSPWKTVP